MTIYGQSEELVSRCVECDLAEPESPASLGGSAPGVVDGILSEYKRAVHDIKDKLRNGDVDLSEIEQILEDKYQAMKHAKGWGEEEDNYSLFTSQSNKKRPKKVFKGFGLRNVRRVHLMGI